LDGLKLLFFSETPHCHHQDFVCQEKYFIVTIDGLDIGIFNNASILSSLAKKAHKSTRGAI
jgi:hypothetical protein